MPWLVPLLITPLLVSELLREGLGPEPVGSLLQVVFAAPLIVSTTVLLADIEQQVRMRTLTPRLRGWLTWTPRVILLSFIAFLAMLSVDVFAEGRGAVDIAIGLLMHNLPALALLATTVGAWRWPWVGALGPAAFAAWWLSFFPARGFPPSVFLLMAALPLTVAAIFLLTWLLGDAKSDDDGVGYPAAAG
jgi:hypothetical protein